MLEILESADYSEKNKIDNKIVF
jgi:hypothetical protein